MSRRSEGVDGRISIGQAARRFNLTERTLRFYDEAGVLVPDRIGKERFYSAEDLNLLRQIMMLKEVGYSISAITSLLSSRKDNRQDGPLLSEHAVKKAVAVLSRKKSDIEAQLERLDLDLSAFAARRLATRCRCDSGPVPPAVLPVGLAE